MSSTGCLIAVGVAVVLVAACGYIGWTYGIGMLEETVRTELRDNPVMREHLGEIQEVAFAVMRTGRTGHADALAFDVSGTKGRGELVVLMADEADEESGNMIGAASLRLPSGETVQLFPDHPMPGSAEEVPPVEASPEVPAPTGN